MKNSNQFLIIFAVGIVIGCHILLSKNADAKNSNAKNIATKHEQIEKTHHDYLKLEQIIKSSQKNYPLILNYYEKVTAQEGGVMANKGFFDIRIKNQYQDKTRGFYDGKLNNFSIEKNNGFMGSKIYGGYRRSSGDFASYDGDNYTNNEGEYRIGGSISLLRDRSIDNARLNFFNSQLDLKESQVQLKKIKQEIARDATKSYWSWVVAGYIFQAYEELYNLAKKRDDQLKILNQKGDIAKIIVTENYRNILTRQSLMQEAKNNFDNSAINLSMYHRNLDGEPLIASINELPKIDFNLEKNFINNLDKDIQHALESRPELQILQIQIQQENNNLSQAKNLYQPRLDLSFEASKDEGKGPSSRSQSNNNLKIDFELPIQQNIAKGKILSTSSKIKAFQYEQQFYRDKIRNEILQLNNSLNNVLKIYHNYLEEVKLSRTLEKAEKERFDNGHSNFFLINLREQEVTSARINKLITLLKYQSFIADYNYAVFRANE